MDGLTITITMSADKNLVRRAVAALISSETRHKVTADDVALEADGATIYVGGPGAGADNHAWFEAAAVPPLPAFAEQSWVEPDPKDEPEEEPVDAAESLGARIGAALAAVDPIPTDGKHEAYPLTVEPEESPSEIEDAAHPLDAVDFDPVVTRRPVPLVNEADEKDEDGWTHARQADPSGPQPRRRRPLTEPQGPRVLRPAPDALCGVRQRLRRLQGDRQGGGGC